MSEIHVQRLQGRIIALELLVRGLLTNFACDNKRPLATAKKMKSEFLASLQNIDRQIGVYEDTVWEAASDQLHLTFDQVIQRIEYQQKHGQIPPNSG